MSKREKAAVLLWLGLSPPEISRLQEVTLETILGYLYAMIGRGVLRSDVFFSMPRDQRIAVSEADSVRASAAPWEVVSQLGSDGIQAAAEDVEVIRRYGAAHHALGDFYEDIRAVEVGLHGPVEEALRGEERHDP